MINGKLLRQGRKSILVRVTFKLLLLSGGCQANRLKVTGKPWAYINIVLFYIPPRDHSALTVYGKGY